MMKIEFDGHKINVPNSWSDVTLGNYEKWYAKKPETKQDHRQYVADICQIDAKRLLDSPKKVFEALANGVQFAFDTDFEPHHSVEVDGEKYFISPSDKLTLGEWVDVDGILNSEEQEHKLSQLLAILCRPVGEKYDIEVTAQRVEMFQTMSCDKALPLVGFFLLRDKNLRRTLHHCSQVVAQANQFHKDTKTFAASGDGTSRLPIWQRIRYYFLMKSLEKQLSKFSDLCSIE